MGYFRPKTAKGLAKGFVGVYRNPRQDFGKERDVTAPVRDVAAFDKKITDSEYRLLDQLQRIQSRQGVNPIAVDPLDLAEDVGKSRSQLDRVISSMERKGLVSRAEDPERKGGLFLMLRTLGDFYRNTIRKNADEPFRLIPCHESLREDDDLDPCCGPDSSVRISADRPIYRPRLKSDVLPPHIERERECCNNVATSEDSVATPVQHVADVASAKMRNDANAETESVCVEKDRVSPLENLKATMAFYEKLESGFDPGDATCWQHLIPSEAPGTVIPEYSDDGLTQPAIDPAKAFRKAYNQSIAKKRGNPRKAPKIDYRASDEAYRGRLENKPTGGRFSSVTSELSREISALESTSTRTGASQVDLELSRGKQDFASILTHECTRPCAPPYAHQSTALLKEKDKEKRKKPQNPPKGILYRIPEGNSVMRRTGDNALFITTEGSNEKLVINVRARLYISACARKRRRERVRASTRARVCVHARRTQTAKSFAKNIRKPVFIAGETLPEEQIDFFENLKETKKAKGPKQPPKPKKEKKRATAEGAATPGFILKTFREVMGEHRPDVVLPLRMDPKDAKMLTVRVPYEESVVVEMIRLLVMDFDNLRSMPGHKPDIHEGHPMLHHLWHHAAILVSSRERGIVHGKSRVSNYLTYRNSCQEGVARPDIDVRSKSIDKEGESAAERRVREARKAFLRQQGRPNDKRLGRSQFEEGF